MKRNVDLTLKRDFNNIEKAVFLKQYHVRYDLDFGVKKSYHGGLLLD